MMRIILKHISLAGILGIFVMNITFSAEPKIITTIYPVYVVVKEVGESVCNVENLIPAGTGPHDYQIKPGDLVKIQNATLVFACGLGLDNWFEDVIAKASVAKKPEIYVIAKGLESSLIYEFVNGNRNNTVNPHFWLDPMLMKHAATNVALKLKNTFTASEKRIDENLKKFSEKMDELDRFITKQFSNIKKRPVICLHNAFSYFAKRYEIEIAGVIEETPDLPSSPQQITKIISIARSKKVCAVFGEIGSSGEIARRVAEELKVPFAMIDTLEFAIDNGATYEDRMKSNALIFLKFMD